MLRRDSRNNLNTKIHIEEVTIRTRIIFYNNLVESAFGKLRVIINKSYKIRDLIHLSTIPVNYFALYESIFIIRTVRL